MASKRLTSEQIDQMRDMVRQGISPEDISKHFNIAISSVHVYKKRFKDEGLDFPVVRGQRPSGDVNTIKKDLVKELDHVEKRARNMIDAGIKKASSIKDSNSDVNEYKFYVNGKLIEIRGDIANIILKKNSIEIVV
jgi:hypothetical protein